MTIGPILDLSRYKVMAIILKNHLPTEKKIVVFSVNIRKCNVLCIWNSYKINGHLERRETGRKVRWTFR